MMLHKRFKEEAFHPNLLMLTKAFLQAGPWRGADRQRKFETWLHGACMVYELPEPTLQVAPAGYTRRVGTYMAESDLSGPIIVLHKFSLVSLFHQFRHHMQHNADPNWDHSHDGQDAQEWGCSLFYLCAPKRFCRAARGGRIAGVEPSDVAG